ncbi:Glutathione S-transferase, N-terminal domain protein [Synechococcus sp. PCC 7335]|uniref:glutathione S-transferase family protein n=1 Tax=Synechococcus sp. (strain ATCC 29403 / PCC 7335) TaxID=91464 RepID=UPI00017EC385|nr:glutathione S-transferase family protein [Synechococcus sp. PCC 7335]EDX85478.1 Glutathione S-transferase, N-terminal domain protein [Synechococcus sp. PCC 7335]
MTNITLYGTPISTYVRTAQLVLSAAEVDYDIKDVGIFNGDNLTDSYLKKHPFGKIPTLEIEGETLYEANAITYFVNEKFAQGKFAPDDLWLQSRMYQIISIINNYLYAPAVSVLTIENLVKPSQGKEIDQAAVEGAIAPSKTALEAIETLVTGDPCLLSSELTIADFYLIPIFFYVSKTPQFDQIMTNTPKLKDWWEAVRSLDLVQEICG